MAQTTVYAVVSQDFDEPTTIYRTFTDEHDAKTYRDARNIGLTDTNAAAYCYIMDIVIDDTVPAVQVVYSALLHIGMIRTRRVEGTHRHVPATLDEMRASLRTAVAAERDIRPSREVLDADDVRYDATLPTARRRAMLDGQDRLIAYQVSGTDADAVIALYRQTGQDLIASDDFTVADIDL